jgi:hypothetical protein
VHGSVSQIPTYNAGLDNNAFSVRHPKRRVINRGVNN